MILYNFDKDLSIPNVTFLTIFLEENMLYFAIESVEIYKRNRKETINL